MQLKNKVGGAQQNTKLFFKNGNNKQRKAYRGIDFFYTFFMLISWKKIHF